MKNLEKNAVLQEMSLQEMESVNGGAIGTVGLILIAAGGLAGGVIVGIGVCYLASRIL